MADAGIIDISPPLRIVSDRPVAVYRSPYAGTHADAASHDDPVGAAIDPLPGRADAP